MVLKLAVLAALVGGASACVNKSYGQCGGQNWTGSTCCPSGYVCTVWKDKWYSQCRPGTPNPTCAAGYAKCGGSGYSGATCCTDGYLCTYVSSSYSQCKPAKCADKPKKKPHVVIVVVDDLGFGDTGFTGAFVGPGGQTTADRSGGALLTPKLDALAAESLTFRNFYTSAYCSPSRSALMTGRYPWRTGYDGGPPPNLLAAAMTLDEKLLPEYFNEQGYKTYGFGKWHLGYYLQQYLPIKRGFSSWKGNMEGGIDHYSHVGTCAILSKAGQLGCANNPPASPVNEGFDFVTMDRASGSVALAHDQYQEQYTTTLITDWAKDMVNNHDTSGGPLFAYIAFNAPHVPLQDPPSDTGDVDACNAMTYSDTARYTLCSMVRAVDRGIGEIVDALKAKNMWDDTYFVFVSDNGGDSVDSGADNGGYTGEKGDLFDGGLRTPMLMHIGDRMVNPIYRKNIRGVTRTDLVHMTDLMVTGLALTPANFNSSRVIDGQDVWASMVCNTPAKRTEIQVSALPDGAALAVNSPTSYPISNKERNFNQRTALIKTINGVTYKYRKEADSSTDYLTYYPYLYDLKNDPLETTNLFYDGAYTTVKDAMVAVQNTNNAAAVKPIVLNNLSPTFVVIAQKQGISTTAARSLFFGAQCLYPVDSPMYPSLNCSTYRQVGAPLDQTI